MTPSRELVDFVAGWEGFEPKAYRDGGGVWTLGYGRTLGVGPGDTCTMAQAKEWLLADLARHWEGLAKYLTREPSQQQADALLSLAYNCGVAAVGPSGTVARFNAGKDQECADRFLFWDLDNGVHVPGLLKRRKAERAIYLDGDYSGRP